MITQALYDARSRNNKFIPVLFEATDRSYIPEPLRPTTYYLLDSEESYQALYDALLGQSGIQPGAVGELERQPRPSSQPLRFDKTVEDRSSETKSESTSALQIWREKLEFLLVEEAVCVDPNMKFRLRHLIDEAREKIRSFGG